MTKKTLSRRSSVYYIMCEDSSFFIHIYVRKGCDVFKSQFTRSDPWLRHWLAPLPEDNNWTVIDFIMIFHSICHNLILFLLYIHTMMKRPRQSRPETETQELKILPSSASCSICFLGGFYFYLFFLQKRTEISLNSFHHWSDSIDLLFLGSSCTFIILKSRENLGNKQFFF